MLIRIPPTALLALAGLIAAAGAAVGTARADEAPIVATRKDGFEANKKSMGAIKAILETGQPMAAVGDHARAMGAFAATIPSLFPAGSDQGDTEARPEIWSRFDDFTAKAKDFETAAKALEEAAAGGDAAAVGKRFAAVGASCKACHDQYKED
ncbi:c-type cytochrome [Azospirillum sp. ST 5-10]|uniref:c-type cytochrome n=1 Tax=unclassified Azospirillum TaxID=2630922 RepID=UPI003F49C62B